MKAGQYEELSETVRKVTDTLVKTNGYAYAAGCLSTILVDTIAKYVKDDADLSMIQIRLLSLGINANLDHMK
jgi:hypothetical protein